MSQLSIDELAYVVPFVLHEDAAPVTKLMSANMISVSSILGIGNEKLTHFLLATHIKRNIQDSEDHTALWMAMLEDFETLMTLDPDARGPWRFLLLFSKADEEVRCVEWGAKSYNAADECCSECLADRERRPWSDMRRSSRWRGTTNFSLPQYVARFRQPLHPLASSKFMWRFHFSWM